MRRIKDYLLRN